MIYIKKINIMVVRINDAGKPKCLLKLRKLASSRRMHNIKYMATDQENPSMYLSIQYLY